MNLAEQLHQANVRIICQWLSSHVGISGNKVADKLANAGRFQPQPVIPATMAHVVSMLRGRRAKIWEEAIRTHDDLRLTKLYKVQWTGDYSIHLTRGDAVQIFCMCIDHTLLLANMSKQGWNPSASCLLYDHQVENTVHVLFNWLPWRTATSQAGGARTVLRSLVRALGTLGGGKVGKGVPDARGWLWAAQTSM